VTYDQKTKPKFDPNAKPTFDPKANPNFCLNQTNIQNHITVIVVRLTIAMSPQGVRGFEEKFEMFRIFEM